MAVEADFSDLVITDAAVAVTFLPTDARLSFARFGALLSPANPTGPVNFGPYPAWEIKWLARKLAQEALLRRGMTIASAQHAPRSPDRPPGSAVPRREADHAGVRNQISLHYQRVVDLTTQSVVAQEALLQRTHPSRGVMPADTFIVAAANTDAVAQIGHWALEHAVAEAARWAEPYRVAISLSAAQLRRADFAEAVRKTLARHALSATRLELQLPGCVPLDEARDNVARLNELKKLGCTVTLDDFGAGNADLASLRLLPIDRIKIDASLVVDLGTSRQAETIVQSIISLGHALQLGVTAQGVQTDAQLASLRAHGCSEAQGSLLGQPRPGPLQRRAAAQAA